MSVYSGQTESAIRARLLSAVTLEVDKAEGSFVHDILSPVAGEMAQAYINLEDVLSVMFASSAYGEYLDKRAGEFGITRKAGVKASGQVTFSGTDATVIPVGTVVSSEGGLKYVTVAEGTISSGTAVISIQAEFVGVRYNVLAGVVKVLPVAIVGVSGVSNANPIAGGVDVEADSALLERLLFYVQNPVSSGNASSYKTWAVEVDGVGDAKVLPLWAGSGTVKVVIIGSDKLPVGAEVVSDVEDYIELERPVGATVTVVSATAKNLSVSVTVTLRAGYLLSDVTTNIENRIKEYLRLIAFRQDYVSYALLGSYILSAEGVSDYSNLTVNGGVANVSVSDTEVAVLNSLSVS